MGATVTYFASLEVICHCSECGVPIAMPPAVGAARRTDGNVFHCYNGHRQCFTESEVARLLREVETDRKKREWADQQAKIDREACERFSRSNAALRGEVTKIKNRVGNGVCPCCNRTFENLARHMTSKHPGYKAEGPTEGGAP